MNREDIAANALQSGDYVDLKSIYDGVERQAAHFMVVPYDIPRKCVATYFPEANPLVPYNQYARRSETPISKSVIIQIEKAKN